MMGLQADLTTKVLHIILQDELLQLAQLAATNSAKMQQMFFWAKPQQTEWKLSLITCCVDFIEPQYWNKLKNTQNTNQNSHQHVDPLWTHLEQIQVEHKLSPASHANHFTGLYVP